MIKKKSLSIFVFLIILISLTGCSDSNEVDSGEGVISGIITSSKTGGIESNVSVKAGGVSTKTNENGEFKLQVSAGTYDVIATKEGFGTSKYQNVKVNSDSTTNLKMVILKSSGSNSTSPTIIVNGINPNDKLSGIEEYTVRINSEVPVNRVNVYQGKEGYYPNYYRTGGSDYKFQWYTYMFPNGKNNLVIEIDDTNHNVTKLKVPIIIDNGDNYSEVTPPAPPFVELYAFTFGKQDYTSLNIKALRSEAKEDRCTIKNVPEDTDLFTELYFSSLEENINGFIIKRSYDGETYKKIGQTPIDTFKDVDPGLTPGEPVYYKIAAYNEGGIGSFTEPIKVIPLPKLNVNLLEPVNEAVGVSVSPTLKWELTRGAASYSLDGEEHEENFYFAADLLNTNESYVFEGIEINDKTQLDLENAGYILDPQTVYQWNISYGEGSIIYTDEADKFVAAVSVCGFQGSSLNGGFTFVTGATK